MRTVLCGALLCLLPAASGTAIGGIGSGPSFVPEATSAALPRIGSLDARGLPRLLAAADQQRYRRIFALQDEARWDEADRLIAQITDRRLLGHVLFQRLMHPTDYRSSYRELQGWLARYADHPGADRVHQLALRRKPADASGPQAPARGDSFSLDLGAFAESASRQRSDAGRATAVDYGTRLEPGDRPTAPAAMAPFSVGRGSAGSWALPGDGERMRRIASRAAELAGRAAPLAHWNSGLAAWRAGDIPEAAAHFQAVVADESASAWDRSAGAYWAARAALRLGQPQEMSHWLRIALRTPRSFYGLLAHQALGVEPRFAFESISYEADTLERLLARSGVARAVALLQVGREELAAAELQSLDGAFDHNEAEALLLLIDRAGLPSMALRLASRLESLVGDDALLGTLDIGLFPLPPWEPESGFRIDRALLYALMRQESAFDPNARSHMGASGLMQIMPRTASYVAGDSSLRGANRHRLLEPAFNLELAQQYLLYLLDDGAVSGDLVRLAAAYNGGPGNLRRWEQALEQAGMDVGDPLLFLESLPSRETRVFIRRVLTNLWIYRQRLGQPTPSLEALAAGEWPRYRAFD